jgi:putative DNA methylase
LGIFKTILTPKADELVANHYRFEGDKGQAFSFFEEGALKAFKQIYLYSSEDIPVTVFYAFKQSESGWETMLSAIIRAGLAIAGAWPIRTELSNRTNAMNSNSLASSIVLVCRKRPEQAPSVSRRDFVNQLKLEMKAALVELQDSNIAPVDLAQSAIGPGMSVFSRFSAVLEAGGEPMTIRSALEIVNQELDRYLTEQDDELDRESRFCLNVYQQHAFNDMKFGEADVLARAKNASVDKLASLGVLKAEKGMVRLKKREEIPEKVLSSDQVIWLLAQQITRGMERDGVIGAAKILAEASAIPPQSVKSMAYRLFKIADDKGMVDEALAYNSLVVSWPEIQSARDDLAANKFGDNQGLFDKLKNQ